jgi:hypothetical protein
MEIWGDKGLIIDVLVRLVKTSHSYVEFWDWYKSETQGQAGTEWTRRLLCCLLEP